MRILVTGGAGYIGSHTVRQLVAEGHDVVVIDNFIYGHRDAIIDDSVRLVEGALQDKAVLDQVFAETIDAVIHFAAFAYVGESVYEPLKYYQNNLAAPIALLERMKEEGCKQFVFSSTCATYGIPSSTPISEEASQNPINPYGRSKWMLEKVLEDCSKGWGLKAVFLRYFNACGCSRDGVIGEDHDPETHLLPRILMAAIGEIDKIDVFGTDYPTADGTCIRDYVHVEDLSDAHVKALVYLTKGGDTTAVNLGVGRGFSVQEVLDTASRVTGREIPVYYGERREGDPPKLIANPSKALKLLGWEAKYQDLDSIIATAWAWMNGPHKGRYPK